MAFTKVASDVLFGLVTKVAIRFRGLLLIPLITINLGVASFGAYSQILAISTLTTTLVELGFHQALVRYGRNADDTADLYYSLLVVVVVTSGAVAAVVFANAPLLSELTLSSDEYVEAYRVGSLLVVVISLFKLMSNYYRMDSRIKLYSTVETIHGYGTIGAIAVSILYLGFDLAGVLVAVILVRFAVLFFLQLHIASEIGVTSPSFEGMSAYLDFSLPVAASLFVGTISSKADRVMIGFFLGASVVGVYSIAYEIATGIMIYVSAIRQTFFPEFSKLLDDHDLRKCGAYVQAGIRYFLIIALPTAGGMYLIGPDVISILTEGEGIPSPLLISVIALGMTARGVDVIYGVVMRAAEETYLRAKIMGTGAAGNIIVNAVAIPLLGIVGAAGATLLTYLFVSVLTIRRVRNIVPFSIPWVTLLRCSVATLAMVSLSRSIPRPGIVVTVVVSVPVYFGILFVLGEITVDEIRTRFVPLD